MHKKTLQDVVLSSCKHFIGTFKKVLTMTQEEPSYKERVKRKNKDAIIAADIFECMFQILARILSVTMHTPALDGGGG